MSIAGNIANVLQKSTKPIPPQRVNVPATITLTGLTPSIDYDVNFGDAPTSSPTGTTDANGDLTLTHTWTAEGDYVVVADPTNSPGKHKTYIVIVGP